VQALRFHSTAKQDQEKQVSYRYPPGALLDLLAWATSHWRIEQLHFPGAAQSARKLHIFH